MQMDTGERSLLAYFPSSSKAEAAAKALKELGISETQIDRVSRYGVDTNDYIRRRMPTDSTVSDMVAFSGSADSYDPDTRILMMSDPSLSGMANSPGYGMAGGKGFLLTVVTDEEHLDKATEIIKENGGTI